MTAFDELAKVVNEEKGRGVWLEIGELYVQRATLRAVIDAVKCSTYHEVRVTRTLGGLQSTNGYSSSNRPCLAFRYSTGWINVYLHECLPGVVDVRVIDRHKRLPSLEWWL